MEYDEGIYNDQDFFLNIILSKNYFTQNEIIFEITDQISKILVSFNLACFFFLKCKRKI